ncbi:MarR family winged helix-turn-helix transcriptional regulator [Amycolatopsis cihanbeyliensis]|uniref:MarR family transcriptional regulator n=1 Tax=Amycolatopsis cihanbeyliensis TaxID=1128664 RepID=A0A542CTU1_AMYCI|nr:MarR family winged helix-turn-helix transcriptional regulator [Amycolatopsis cihanbeyliensis]TQI94242.1 MarR family transcriptional regulator [Amycolatopsis cihanbeyliensis]
MDATPDGGPALFRLVRFWSRRWINRAAEELPGDLRQVQHILAVEAVRAAGGGTEEATVSTVAHQLGLDHSGASRIVRDATAAGYLLRTESEQDRRRATLRLTPGGEELLAESRQWQRAVFVELTASWSEHDREQFAGYLRRLAGELGV